MTSESEFTVVICAYTLARWDALREAVKSVRAQTVPAREILVVIDRNEELRRVAERELEGVTVVANRHTGGLSGGRQTGAEHATAPLLAFLDDDAIAAPDWLEQLGAAYEDPRTLGAGGRVDPIWLAQRPSWFPEELDWVVGCTYAGMPERAGRIRNPIGANMSVRADVLAAAGTFESKLGRTVTADVVTGTAEETEFAIRATMRHPGGHWAYVPAARVQHLVPPERATWSYFLRRCRVEGQAKAILAGLAGGVGLDSERAYVSSVLPRAIGRELAATARGRRVALLRAGAIIAGVSVTGWAYVGGRVRLRLYQPRKVPR